MRSESKIAEWCRGAESARVTAVGAGAPHRRLIALTGPRSADELGEDLGRVALHTRRRSLPRHPRLRCLVNRGAYLVPILIAALLNSTADYFSLVIVRGGRPIFFRCKSLGEEPPAANGNGVLVREMAGSDE